MIRAIALSAMLVASPAAACNLALSLGLDASSSMSPAQWQMQIDGTANALLSPQVRQAVEMVAPIRVHVFAWAGIQDGSGWVVVRTAADLEAVAAAVRGLSRLRVGIGTSMGAAMLYAAEELRQQPCGRRVLDLSGDGNGNGQPTAAVAASELGASFDITVNGIGIGENGAEAFTDAKAGPGAFTMHAETFEDFERVLIMKLLAELLS